ncbi:hypothetical protein BUE80_DR002936 [Diplocarpon rosae]|nr:hypothetical protein BUE80_DR002936 [Diplocarpon rosae]
MAWGRSSIPKPSPPPKSALSKLLPLLILLIVLGGLALMGYYVYLAACGISTVASKKMENKNIVFTKDGVKVGVKELRNENYVDNTQSIMVKAWNLAKWPGYKSSIWNQDGKIDNKASSRKPFTREVSSAKK